MAGRKKKGEGLGLSRYWVGLGSQLSTLDLANVYLSLQSTNMVNSLFFVRFTPPRLSPAPRPLSSMVVLVSGVRVDEEDTNFESEDPLLTAVTNGDASKSQEIKNKGERQIIGASWNFLAIDVFPFFLSFFSVSFHTIMVILFSSKNKNDYLH